MSADELGEECIRLRRELDFLRAIVREAGLAFGLPVDAGPELVAATIRREWIETQRAREFFDVRHEGSVYGSRPNSKHAEYVAAASTGLRPAGPYLPGTQLSRSEPWGFSKRDALNFVEASQIVRVHARTVEELASRLVLIDRAMWHTFTPTTICTEDQETNA